LPSSNAGGASHTHWGTIRHDDLIGIGYGQQVLSSKKKPYRVFKATLSEFIYAMPRGAQVIYPKDLAQILFNLDLFPGAKVLESGVGSGALSTSLVRAGALVDGVELREEFATIAMKNLRSLVAPDLWSKYQIRMGNAYEDDLGSGYDRAVLDLPEPWRALEGVRSAISQTGILCCFVTNITQLMELHEALPRSGFTLVTSSETLEREWYLNGRIARPQHRMTAHSGFITTARVAPPRKKGSDQPTLEEDSVIAKANGQMGVSCEELS
jgi:tRNA (adenine57-N1/adenine58-N1)-methyltransferase